MRAGRKINPPLADIQSLGAGVCENSPSRSSAGPHSPHRPRCTHRSCTRGKGAVRPSICELGAPTLTASARGASGRAAQAPTLMAEPAKARQAPARLRTDRTWKAKERQPSQHGQGANSETRSLRESGQRGEDKAAQRRTQRASGNSGSKNAKLLLCEKPCYVRRAKCGRKYLQTSCWTKGFVQTTKNSQSSHLIQSDQDI